MGAARGRRALRRSCGAVTAAATALLLALVAAPGAAAHPGHATHAGGPVVVTQSVGPYELRTRVTPQQEPRALTVDVDLPVRPPSGARLTVGLVPAGVPLTDPPTGGPTGRVTIDPDDAGPYSVRFPGVADGPWEVHLAAAGDAGGGVASVPFAVVAPPRSGPATAALTALAVLGALVAVLVVLALRRTPHRGALLGVGALAVAAGAVVLTLAAQSVLVPVADRTADPAAAGDRPPAGLLVTADRSVDGTTAVRLDLVDGSTGRPVDDLVPHHEALVHLVVLHTGSDWFAHLHPARTGPGRFEVVTPPSPSGEHVLHAEVSRSGSGGQLLTARVVVGDPADAPRAAPGPGAAPLAGPHGLPDGLEVHAQVGDGRDGPAPAGTPTTLRFRIARDGVPVSGTDPWLGMPGHLLVDGAPGGRPLFAHVHAARPVPSGAAPPARSAGPELLFVYTFPRPGVHRVRVQFLLDRTVRTMTATLDVAPARGAS